MKPIDSKTPIKQYFLFAIASYMLTQAALLVLGAAANFTAFPSLMHYHVFDSSNVLLSWNFSDDGTLPHMLMLWGLGTVLFAAIFWLFLHFGHAEEVSEKQIGGSTEPSGGRGTDVAGKASDPSVSPADLATSPADLATSPAGTATSPAGTVPHVEVHTGSVPPALARYRQPVRGLGGDDGTSLGVIALICGLIAFIPGLGLVFAIAAIICGALGNIRASAAGNSAGRTLSIIGIVLAAISLLLTVSTVMFLGSLFSALFGTMV